MALQRWTPSGAGGGLWRSALGTKRLARRAGSGLSTLRGAVTRAKVHNITSLPQRPIRTASSGLGAAPKPMGVPAPVKSAGVSLAGGLFNALDRHDARKPVCVVCREKYPVSKRDALCARCMRGVAYARHGDQRPSRKR